MVFTVIVAAVSGSAGYFIKDSLDKKRELINEVNKERREVYQQTINLMIELFASAKKDEEAVFSDTINQLYDIYKKNLLYASPEVINAFADLMQHVYKDPNSTDYKTLFKKLTTLFAAMREDLGLDNDDLGEDYQNLIRAMFTDFDTIMQ